MNYDNNIVDNQESDEKHIPITTNEDDEFSEEFSEIDEVLNP